MIESIPLSCSKYSRFVASPRCNPPSTLYDVSRFEHLYRTPNGALETSPVAKTQPDTLSHGFELALKVTGGPGIQPVLYGVDALKKRQRSPTP